LGKPEGFFYSSFRIAEPVISILKLTPAIAYLLLLNSVFSCSRSKNIKTPEEKERAMIVKNKIKTITEYRTSVFLGVNQKEQFSRVRHFNNSGFIIGETDYKPDGNIDCMVSYEYDKKGNLITTTAINPDSSLLFRETKRYDDHNNRKELYFFLPDGSYKYRNIASYNGTGRMAELAWYWPEGFKSKNKYEYEGGKKISDTEYDAKGNLTYKWIYRYDSAEHLIDAIQYDSSGTVNRKICYEFNKKKQTVKEKCYVGEYLQNSNSFLYDERGLLLSKTLFSSSGRITAVFRYQYDLW
jgi:hypothetical protein